MSELIIKVEGKKIEFFDNVAYSSQIDAISSSFSFDTFFDIKTYEFAKIEVLRNNTLIFTGKVISKTIPNEVTPKPINYKCYSLTGILEDSTLPLDSYPIQTQDKSLKEIVQKICDSFNVTVKFDSSASSDLNAVYTLQDQSPDEKAIDIINKLCSQRNLLLTHNVKGELIITKKLSETQGILNNILQSNKSYNYRNFYRNYVILGQQGIQSDASRKSVSKFSVIDEKRNITKIQSDGDSDVSQKQADAFKYDSYKSNTFDVQLNDEFVNIGQIYIVNNVKCVCNSVNYNYRAGQETCAISLLNPKVYERN